MPRVFARGGFVKPRRRRPRGELDSPEHATAVHLVRESLRGEIEADIPKYLRFQAALDAALAPFAERLVCREYAPPEAFTLTPIPEPEPPEVRLHAELAAALAGVAIPEGFHARTDVSPVSVITVETGWGWPPAGVRGVLVYVSAVTVRWPQGYRA